MLELATPASTLNSRARKVQRTLMEDTTDYQRYQGLRDEYDGQAKQVKRLERGLMPALLLTGFGSMAFGHSAMMPSWYTWATPWMFISLIAVAAVVSGILFGLRQRAIRRANRTVEHMQRTERKIRETVASKIRYDLKMHHNMVATVDMDDGNVTVEQDGKEHPAIIWYDDRDAVPSVRLIETDHDDVEEV